MGKIAEQAPNASIEPNASAAEWVELSSLNHWARNPRKNDEAVDGVARSIIAFGWGSPILARPEDRRIIAGHTRAKAAVRLSALWDKADGDARSKWHQDAILTKDNGKAPVRWKSGLSEKQADALALADNRLGEKADWDDSVLACVLQTIDLDLALIAGWSAEDFEALAKSVGDTSPATEGEDDHESPGVTRGTVAGDVWELDGSRIICGDCRIPGTLEKIAGGSRVSLAFTSPPYASQRVYDESSGFKPIAPDKYVAWFEPVQRAISDLLAPDGSWFVNIKPASEGLDVQLYVADLVVAHVRQWGWHFATEFCWERSGIPGKPRRRFKNQFEPIYQFAKAEWKFRPEAVRHESGSVPGYSRGNHLSDGLSDHSQGKSGSFDNEHSGLAYPGNRISVGQNRIEEGVDHPAAFPVALVDFFVQAYTDEGDLVCDPFSGTGTTVLSAHMLGRKAIGSEISPAYVEMGVRRWEKATGNKAVRVPGKA